MLKLADNKDAASDVAFAIANNYDMLPENALISAVPFFMFLIICRILKVIFVMNDIEIRG